MKPKVFLSHSKKDKVIIERIANDLRKCGIDVWYDEWEIPVGESIRKKIFEEGIPNCDIFFIYLSENSLESYWVQKELDSAIFRDAEEKNNLLILFVDKNETRNKLSYDLKALSIPEFNENEYLIPFTKLVSKTWQSQSKKIISDKTKEMQKEKLTLEKEKFELEKKIFNIEKQGLIDFDKVEKLLESQKIEMLNAKTVSYFEAFKYLKHKLAIGSTTRHLEHILNKKNMVLGEDLWSSSIEFDLDEFVGELIIQGLVKVVLPSSENVDYNILTDSGITFAKRFNYIS